MNELSNPALVYLVQLVDREARRLTAQVDAMDAGDVLLPDIEEQLLDCSQVASELRRLYATAEKSAGNMPGYTQLVSRQS